MKDRALLIIMVVMALIGLILFTIAEYRDTEKISPTDRNYDQTTDLVTLHDEDGETWAIARTHIQVVLPSPVGGSMVWHDHGCIHYALETPQQILDIIGLLPTRPETSTPPNVPAGTI